MNNCISFSDTGMEVLGYMLAKYTALKVMALRFHFYLESKMAAKTQNGCRYNCISFSDTGMEVLGYMLAKYTALKVMALRFHFYLESKMAAKTQNGCRQCVELTIAPCEQSRENWMLV